MKSQDCQNKTTQNVLLILIWTPAAVWRSIVDAFPDRSYYIPGDAILYGTMTNNQVKKKRNPMIKSITNLQSRINFLSQKSGFPAMSQRKFALWTDSLFYPSLTSSWSSSRVKWRSRHHDKVWNDGEYIRIFGHGTLSGDFVPHPNYADPPVRFPSGKFKYGRWTNCDKIGEHWIYLGESPCCKFTPLYGRIL